MKTFTLDSTNGVMNPQTKEVEDRATKQLQEVAYQFIKDCVDNDIEVSSSEGFFYSLAFQALTEARLKYTYELKKAREKERQQ